MEHLQAKAQKLEGRNFAPRWEFILWQEVGSGAMVQEHVFQTSVLGWDVYSNFDFHKGAHLGSCGLAKANFLVVCVSKMLNFCDFALEMAKKCGENCPKLPNFGTVGLTISIYAVARIHFHKTGLATKTTMRILLPHPYPKFEGTVARKSQFQSLTENLPKWFVQSDNEGKE